VPLRIENAIDMHCHFGPDTIGGRVEGPPMVINGVDTSQITASVTALEAAREAWESGHKAIVLKSHSFCSCQVAASMEEAVPGLRVFGGATTDYGTGGLDPLTVESALQLGARIIWLPTVSSRQDAPRHGKRFGGKPGIPVTGDDGEPTATVREVFDLVRQYDAVLATGHTTKEEHYAVARAFGREGKVLVTHAGEEIAGPHLNAAEAKELADLGATIELTAQCCVSVFNMPPKSHKAMAEIIETIGHERCTLSSDYGWSTMVPKPAPGFKDFLEKLWEIGVPEAHLNRMAAATPARLLSLQ